MAQRMRLNTLLDTIIMMVLDKFSWQKNVIRKSTMQMFINNNARFCYQSK